MTPRGLLGQHHHHRRLDAAARMQLAADVTEVMRGHVFLGMCAARCQPKREASSSLVEQLRGAGIRFIFFSADHERAVRSFGAKLGLETDWNCCINLRDPEPGAAPPPVLRDGMRSAGAAGAGAGPSRASLVSSAADSRGDLAVPPAGRGPSFDNGSVRGGSAVPPASERGGAGGEGEGDPEPPPPGMQPMQKLPYGISAVRPHIAEVDNVPLLVSLFSDAAPEATREMISILQEHGEVVLCLGSASNVDNAATFAQSDVAVAIDPLPPYVCVRGDRPRPALPPAGAAAGPANASPGPARARHTAGGGSARWRIGRDTTGARLGARFLASARRLFGANSSRLTVSALRSPASPHAVHRTPPGHRLRTASRSPQHRQPAQRPAAAQGDAGGAQASSPPQWEEGDVCAARVSRVEDFGRALNTLACPVLMRRETNLSEVLDLLAEGRRLLNNTRQSLLFFAAANLQLFFVVFASQCLFFPTIYTGYQILWLQLVQIPLLAASVLACPMEQNIMRRMADKNTGELAHWRRYGAYFAARFLPPACLVLFAFAWALAGSGGPAAAAAVWAAGFDRSAGHGGLGYQWGLLRAQNAALFYHVAYLAVSSASFHHRTASLRDVRPHRNRVWLVAAPLALAFQAAFYAVSAASAGPPPWAPPGADWSYFPSDPVTWWGAALLLGTAAPAAFVGLDELCKRHDRQRLDRYNRKLWLEFNTKLGMHSPLRD